MKNHKPPYIVRPQTALITRGFDPGLSAGSARPPVFRSATYVFSSPEAAAKAFAIATGKAPLEEGERKNAQHIIDGLTGHKSIERIYYPALFTDAGQKRIRDAQCRIPGAMFSITLRGGKRAAFDFLRNLRIIKKCCQLGRCRKPGVSSGNNQHIQKMSIEDLHDAGIPDSMVRVSVGVEDWRDLLRDIRQALG